jgi:23S rRNA (guanosine2251-2'-O)-methyltransferase
VKRRNFVNRRPPQSSQPCVYGVHAITGWLRAAPRRLLGLQYVPEARARLNAIFELATAAGIPLHLSSAQALAGLAGTTRHQGIVATAAPFPYVKLEELIARGSRLLIAADQIQDPHNLGALFRTAEAVGAGGVVIPKDGSVPVTATVEAAAAGAAARLLICKVTNLVRAIQSLKVEDYWSVGLAPHGGIDLYEFESPERVVIVVGGETGMRPLIGKHCDFAVSIPMFGQAESLNASVAAAIILYELRRRWGPP